MALRDQSSDMVIVTKGVALNFIHDIFDFLFPNPKRLESYEAATLNLELFWVMIQYNFNWTGTRKSD
jgi:hypothetical protein